MKPTESLQKYEAQIFHLMRGAYPKAVDEECEEMPVDRFIDGLHECQRLQLVKLACPRTSTKPSEKH